MTVFKLSIFSVGYSKAIGVPPLLAFIATYPKQVGFFFASVFTWTRLQEVWIFIRGLSTLTTDSGPGPWPGRHLAFCRENDNMIFGSKAGTTLWAHNNE